MGFLLDTVPLQWDTVISVWNQTNALANDLFVSTPLVTPSMDAPSIPLPGKSSVNDLPTVNPVDVVAVSPTPVLADDNSDMLITVKTDEPVTVSPVGEMPQQLTIEEIINPGWYKKNTDYNMWAHRAWTMGMSESTFEELWHDALIDAYLKYDSTRGAKFSTYLHWVTRKAMTDYWRQTKRNNTLLEQAAADGIDLNVMPVVETPVNFAEFSDKFDELLMGLPEVYKNRRDVTEEPIGVYTRKLEDPTRREIARLLLLDHLSQVAVAEKFGVTRQNISQVFKTIKKQLKQYLQSEEGKQAVARLFDTEAENYLVEHLQQLIDAA